MAVKHFSVSWKFLRLSGRLRTRARVHCVARIHTITDAAGRPVGQNQTARSVITLYRNARRTAKIVLLSGTLLYSGPKTRKTYSRVIYSGISGDRIAIFEFVRHYMGEQITILFSTEEKQAIIA